MASELMEYFDIIARSLGGEWMTFGMVLGLILIPAAILALGIVFYFTTSHYDQEDNL